ncbi:MAG: helix-turn-helix domain-containing protein, partial [Chloroflexi bacterium]
MESTSDIEQVQPRPRLRLTEARNERDLSQQQVADMIGTTHVNISRWERGITKPNPYFRRKLSQVFGKTEEALDLVSTLASATTEEKPAGPPATLPARNGRTAASTPLPVPATPASVEPVAIYDPIIPLQPAIPLVGRERDLGRIKRRLYNGGNVALTALNGLPGVGKTALSTALAHDPEVRTHFSDGILWAGLGPNPNIAGLLSRWGSLLGIAATEMASLKDSGAWARALRTAIGSRKMLLVIDDAWKIEEALTFKVGGPNCAHMLTTRYRDVASHIAFDGATEIQELSEEESMALLRLLAPAVVEREGKRTLDLIRAVGGLPLALTLMGNYLRKQAYSGQPRRIATALQRLSSATERLQISEPHGPVESHPSLTSETQVSLQSVIAVTDQVLPQDARHALYALSVFPPKPNSFSEDAALAVIDGGIEALDL